jgi:hypothetical protein
MKEKILSLEGLIGLKAETEWVINLSPLSIYITLHKMPGMSQEY